MFKRYLWITLLIAALSASGVMAQGEFVFTDGRLDQRPDAPIVLYCRFDNGLSGFVAGGGVAFDVSRRQIETSLARSAVDRVAVSVVSGAGGAQLTAFPDNGLVLTAPLSGGTYSFTIPASACGSYKPDFTNAVTVLVGAVDGLLNLPSAGSTSTTGSTVQASNTTIIISGDSRTHTVQRGENLFRIGLRYGVPFSEIARVNGLSNANSIYAGQVLAIPPR